MNRMYQLANVRHTPTAKTHIEHLSGDQLEGTYERLELDLRGLM